jgi:hypothetical protein
LNEAEAAASWVGLFLFSVAQWVLDLPWLLGFLSLPPRSLTMGQLRDRMAQDLTLKGVSPATRRNYLLYCRKFAAFFMRSPEELGAADVRAFLLHQIEVEQLSYSSYRQVYAALKFLYSVTLGRPGEVCCIPFPKRQPSRLAKVLTAEELTAFFATRPPFFGSSRNSVGKRLRHAYPETPSNPLGGLPCATATSMPRSSICPSPGR